MASKARTILVATRATAATRAVAAARAMTAASTATAVATAKAAATATAAVAAAAVVLVVAMVLLAACGSSGPESGDQPWMDGGADTTSATVPAGNTAGGPQPGGQTAPGSATGADGSDWILTGDDAHWPDYIPDDIPPLEGDIRQIMQGSVNLRIFYTGLSEQQIAAWLNLLQQKGFQIDFVVYVQEGFPDNSEERIAEGDFDAVHISKDKYLMDLSLGGGDATLDMQTGAFADVYPFTPERDWPAALAAVIPPPDRCDIEAVYEQDAGYQVVVRPHDKTAVADYVATLEAAGWAPKPVPVLARAPVGGDYKVVYGKDDAELTVDYSTSVTTARLTVYMVEAADVPAWPGELVGVVPEPESGVIRTIVELGHLDWIITCSGPGASFMSDYADQLMAAGFTETGRTDSPGGAPTSIELEKAGIKVELAPGIMDEVRIKVTDEP